MRTALTTLGVLLLGLSCVAGATAQDDLADREEAAFKAAVHRAAPAVVRIQTVGGAERVGQVLVGTGPTTGVIVSEDGYIVSSLFNFAQKPTSILVTLPDQTRARAELVATDHSRMLVLLKVNVQEKLPVPEAAPEGEVRVGQWAIALGRAFEGTEPNVSVGLISAVKRIWGRAVQTDAKISPSNYGGPLLDIRGRVVGVLVPLSPQGGGAIGGVQWYDSGIGFAVPLEQIQRALPRLKEGQDLYPGIMGINLKPGNQFADPAVVAAVRANSPAYQAGLEVGDQINKIGDVAIKRQIQVKEALGPYYAGDSVHLVVLRDKQEHEFDLELIDKLQPYARPFLGVLPLRVAKAAEGEEAPQPGVVVRHVYSGSGADGAGIQAGDRITAVDGKPVADADALREVIRTLQPGAKPKIEVRQGEQTLHLEAELGTQPEGIPDKLPAAMAKRPPFVGQAPPLGKQPLKLAEYENDCFTYVPVGYDPAVPHGLLVWLHEPNGLKTDEQVDELINSWRELCDAHDLILVAPRSANPLRWDPAKEVAYVAKLVEKLRATYNVDDTRIVAHGYQAGGAMAYAVAFNQRELFRGVAAVDAPLSARAPEADPVHPLAFYTTKAKQGRAPLDRVEAGIKRLQDMKYPVTVRDQGDKARPLEDAERKELARWVDSLDRI